jgi:hypothetical protein
MFKSVYLGNFKAFGPTQRIPIRPLTLIFGPNSAGKSSFLHGLLYAHEALTSDEPNNLDVKRPRLGGDSVDLGGFRQLIHKKNIAHRVEWGVELDTAELQGRLAELLAPVKTVSVIVTIGLEELEVADPHQLPLEGPDVGKQVVVTIPSYEPGNRNQKITVTLGPRVETYRIEVDSTVLLRASVKRRGEEWRMGVDELDTEHPVIHNVVRAIVEATTTAASFNPEDTQAVQDAIDQLVTDLSLAPGPLLPTGVQRSGGPQAEGGQPALFPISRGNRREDLRQAVLFFLPRSLNELVRELADVIGRRLRSLRYLGPLRSYPPRHLAFAQYHDPNWQAGGGFAWDRVRTSPEIREATNKWLGSAFMKTPYQLLVRNLYADDDLYDPLWSTLENVELDTEVDYDRDGPQGSYPIIKDFDREVGSFYEHLRRANIESVQDLVLVDVNRKTVVSHRDIGIGVSQVLPVLVSAFAAEQETVAIEQPEIHLHPGLQAELGDVFVNAALGAVKNHFIIETHSEHLILRLLRRIRETSAGKNETTAPIKPEDVMLLYVQVADAESRFIELRVDQRGRLIDPCPDGFFEEDFAELF